MQKNIIIFFFLILFLMNFTLFYRSNCKVENFKAINDQSVIDEDKLKKAVDSLYTNKIEDYVKDNIKRIYKTDIDSIRNLEKLSKLLQSGGYTVAGDLTIKGNLKCEKNLDVKGKKYYFKGLKDPKDAKEPTPSSRLLANNYRPKGFRKTSRSLL